MMKMIKKNSILFINLAAFSLTGGIEKFNKSFLKALSELGMEKNWHVESYSLYDTHTDENYFPEKLYSGFGRKKIKFVITSLLNARKFDKIIIGHINLSIVGYLIKTIFPKKSLTLITHGIEVWSPLAGIKKTFINKTDKILAVSNFTKNKITAVQKIDGNRIAIFPNTIDSFFSIPSQFITPDYLKKRYNFNENDFVLFTLTRLSSAEKYKGYDVVLQCLPGLLEQIPTLKYIIGGKYDPVEKERVDALINELKVNNVVQFAGFIKDEEICDHYQVGDIFIMPSKGEGFGIVFIEAAICGSKIIAGNKDGSVDALQNGELGVLVDPSDKNEISKAILLLYQNKSFWQQQNKKNLQQQTLNHFGFPVYKKRLNEVLID